MFSNQEQSMCIFSYSEYLSDSGKFKHKPYTTKSKKIHMQLIYNIYMYKKGKKYYEPNSGQIIIYSLLALTGYGYISQVGIQV